MSISWFDRSSICWFVTLFTTPVEVFDAFTDRFAGAGAGFAAAVGFDTKKKYEIFNKNLCQ